MGVRVMEVQICADVGLLHKYFKFNGEDVFYSSAARHNRDYL